MKPRDASAWFRQPVAWLAATVLLSTLLACIATIVIAFRHADTPVDVSGGVVMKVPLRHADEKR